MKKLKQSGITLVALVITIIVLLILAGITLNLMIGQEGIITKAQEAGKIQKIAEIKEKIGLAILDAETEAKIRKEQLEQEQVKDIISKYGELQEDGDTIKLKEVDAEVSLKDIYNGTTSNTGSYTANKEKIEQLENQVAELEKALEESSATESEKAQELTQLKELLAQTTVTEDRILKGYTAYKNDKLITGTMENRGELNWNPSESTSYTIPAGFYSGGTISTKNAYTAGYESGADSNTGEILTYFEVHNYSRFSSNNDTGTRTYNVPADLKNFKNKYALITGSFQNYYSKVTWSCNGGDIIENSSATSSSGNNESFKTFFTLLKISGDNVSVTYKPFADHHISVTFFGS